MNLKNHLFPVVSGAVSVVLISVCGFSLFRYQSAYQDAAKSLREATEKLDRLSRRDPSPTPENVAAAQKDRDALNTFLGTVRAALQRDQIEDEPIEAAEFAVLLERNVRELRAAAQSSGTRLPETTSLGFDRYTKGELPHAAAIPRLVAQVKIIRVLLNLLVEQKVDELVDVQREVFEGEPGAEVSENVVVDRRFASATGGSDAKAALSLPPPESNDLYSVERVILSFKANESAAWQVLNALARSRMFMVVKHVEIRNSALPVVSTPAATAASEAVVPGGLTIYPSREERVIAGREPVQVDVVVDVYRIATPPAEAAS